MRVIKPSTLTQWATEYPNAAPSLLHWLQVTLKAKWKNHTELRQHFPHADQVRVESKRPVIVINISGNNYRLICAIHFNRGYVYLLDFLTHADYSNYSWKKHL
jgi:mRNA interferase HigB